MKSVFSGAGYLIADNRASDAGGFEEADIIGCRHCQAAVKAHDWRTEGAFCHHCAAPICDRCAAIPGCTPFEKAVERALSEQHRRQQNARVLGI